MVDQDWRHSDARWEPNLVMTLALGMAIAAFLAIVH
jgi:hypothetical protein